MQLLIEAGGPVVVILMAMSVVSVTVILLKAWHLISVGSSYKKECLAALDSWSIEKNSNCVNKFNQKDHPVKQVLATALFGLSDKKLNLGQVRDEVTRIARQELEHLRSYLKVLEVIAALSPLLGLLGTVIGMIKAFQSLQVAGAQVDPAVLSGGIWEALLTTAVGLVVAIPTLAMYHWLDKKVETIRMIMEDYVTRAFSADAHYRIQALQSSSNISAGNTLGHSVST